MQIWVEVVLNVPLFQSFFYCVPSDLAKNKFEVAQGKRAEVMFGRTKAIGYIIAVYNELPQTFTYDPAKIRDIIRILDEKILFTLDQLTLARWISDFYISPLGEVLATMIPSGKRESHSFSLSFGEDFPESKEITFSQEQKRAVSGILEGANNKGAILHYLYGPTGSGKTEVFLQAAEQVLAEQRGVIYLVPEIGLTHQVLDAVRQRFGKTVAVLHSGLTPSQKLSEWHRILQREARIIIGVRSAVFAPVPDLGLIIIDEEHDSSYKSSNAPRYHARQVAIKRAKDLQIPLVMGSATPSVEAWKLMSDGDIIKHTLTKRLSGGTMPVITIVDMSTLTDGAAVSPLLQEEILNAKKENRQSVLFLNRRGFTHYFSCKTCGSELKCKNCSVSLTFHKAENRVRCHYCGWSMVPPKICPECQSLDIGYYGFGTEFIETELAVKFPQLKVLRIDADSITKKGQLEQTLADFRNGNADILLGTQMIAKGLNFPNVKLVGIINADTGLQMPDFRSAERSFSLIVQAAGRAGRYFPDGKVIVQSYNPKRSAIAFACSNKIAEFYEYELNERSLLCFPPFSRIIRLVFRSKVQKGGEEAANAAGSILHALHDAHRKQFTQPIHILGPVECPLAQIAQNYRYQILLRSTKLAAMQFLCRTFITNYKAKGGVFIEVDVDPVNLL